MTRRQVEFVAEHLHRLSKLPGEPGRFAAIVTRELGIVFIPEPRKRRRGRR